MPERPKDTTAVCDYRSDDLAKEMLENLIGEKNFDINDIEWDDSKITVPDDLMSSWKTDVDPVTIEELTSRKLFGSGVFDAIMESIHTHLKIEYDAGRITGAEYATTYTKLSEAALTNAVHFTLNKNQAYFQGILAQAQAITAGINAQIAAITAKVQLAKTKAEALGVAANYALTAMKLSTEDAQHALTCKQQEVADKQIQQTEAQTELLKEQKKTQAQQTSLVQNQAKMQAIQARLLDPDQTDDSNLDYQIKEKQLTDYDNKAQISTLQLQANQPTGGANDPHKNIDFLIKEAQLDTENDKADLYKKQGDAYQHKWELDIAALYANQYTAMKSVDEGLALPKAFSGASINEVVQLAKVSAGLGADNTTLSGDELSNYLKNGILRTASDDINKNEDEKETSNP